MPLIPYVIEKSGREERAMDIYSRLLADRIVMLGSGVPAHVSMAGVHRVASLVQRWVLGTHHGSVQPDHLDAYLDEFVFRFNRRTSSSRGMLFYRLLQQAVVTPPVTYGDVVSKNTGESQSDTIAG